MARACIFCGGGPVTNTHIFRRGWIKEIAPGAVDFRHRRGPQPHLPGPLKHEWIDDAVELKVNAACQVCNGGWMEQLDLAAERVFLTHACLGYPVKLDVMADKLILARWCALIATLGDQTFSTPTIPRGQQQALCAGEIPQNMRAWIFRTEPPRDVLWLSKRHLTITGRCRRTGIEHTLNVYCATFGVQQFVCHVAIPTDDPLTGSEVIRKPSGVAREICPPSLTPLIWPPPETLSWENAMNLPDQLQRDIHGG